MRAQRPGRDSGEREQVLPGNKEFTPGDVIRKPESGGGGRGNKGSNQGGGEDDFVFSLSREEFLDIFFEDLALPNLVKAKLKTLKSPEPFRAGFMTDGPPAKMNHVRTMRNSLARRIALRRPKTDEIESLQAELAEAEQKDPRDEQEIEKLLARLDSQAKGFAGFVGQLKG